MASDIKCTTTRLQLQHKFSLNMHFIHPIYDMVTWHNVPANLWTITCMPTIYSRQRRTSGEGKRCNKSVRVCVYKVLVSCVGNVAVLPAAPLKITQGESVGRCGLSVASVRGRIVGCYIQTGIPAILDFCVDTNGKHGLCVSTSEMCRGWFSPAFLLRLQRSVEEMF